MSDRDSWYIESAGAASGPFTFGQLQKLAASGELQPEYEVRRNEQPAHRASEFRGLVFPQTAAPSKQSLGSTFARRIVVTAIVWLLASLAAWWLLQAMGVNSTVSSVILVAAVLVGIFLFGTAIWARAKGHSAIEGIILGAFGPLGMLVLVLLPDES